MKVIIQCLIISYLLPCSVLLSAQDMYQDKQLFIVEGEFLKDEVIFHRINFQKVKGSNFKLGLLIRNLSNQTQTFSDKWVQHALRDSVLIFESLFVKNNDTVDLPYRYYRISSPRFFNEKVQIKILPSRSFLFTFPYGNSNELKWSALGKFMIRLRDSKGYSNWVTIKMI